MSCEGYYLECQSNECINRETPSSAKDARIAELTAEVARYKAAMQSIVDDYKQAFHTDWTTAANYAEIARNALKDGKS